jgi:hypothetical protein
MVQAQIHQNDLLTGHILQQLLRIVLGLGESIILLVRV